MGEGVSELPKEVREAILVRQGHSPLNAQRVLDGKGRNDDLRRVPTGNDKESDRQVNDTSTTGDSIIMRML